MVYVFLVDGFEEIEALAPVDLMRRAGIEVQTVGVNGKSVTGSRQITVQADIDISEVDFAQVDGVVLPGGPGTPKLAQSDTVSRIILHAVANNKYIGAICAAPSVLGQMGLLRGKKATCFPGYESELIGAEKSCDPICRDGFFITAVGMGVSILFGLALVEVFTSAEKADEIRKWIQSA